MAEQKNITLSGGDPGGQKFKVELDALSVTVSKNGRLWTYRIEGPIGLLTEHTEDVEALNPDPPSDP